jgi:hypothetical protein
VHCFSASSPLSTGSRSSKIVGRPPLLSPLLESSHLHASIDLHASRAFAWIHVACCNQQTYKYKKLKTAHDGLFEACIAALAQACRQSSKKGCWLINGD